MSAITLCHPDHVVTAPVIAPLELIVTKLDQTACMKNYLERVLELLTLEVHNMIPGYYKPLIRPGSRGVIVNGPAGIGIKISPESSYCYTVIAFKVISDP